MWARKIDWKFCCRRNYCSYFFFFRVTEFINVSSYAIYAAHLQCNFSISFVDGIEVVFHSIAHYTDANIVSQVCLIFINTNCQSTINQSYCFNLSSPMVVDCVFSTLNFAPISCDTIYPLSHLRIYSCCIWTKDGFFPGNAYYVYPEIATFVRNLG